MKKETRNLLIVGVGLAVIYGALKAVAKKRMEDESIDDDNPYIKSNSYIKEGALRKVGIYEGKVKPVLDQILSFVGLIVLSPLYGAIALAIKIDDPGQVFFTQKRIGKNKTYFMCHKFRSMKMSTPHDVPTHQLSNPEQYITRVGKFLRSSSLDELPQLWDIFRGRMSVIGPRPALWNQDDLVAERDKYNANDVMPGLTGLAQISGRDELEIPDKAKIDGEYVKKQGFFMDMQCFLGTIVSVLKHDGVVEGGTGSISNPHSIELVDPADVGFEDYGYKKKFNIDKDAHKKVLITGKGSYIGESFRSYCESYYPNIECTTIDMMDGSWRKFDFSNFNTVFHVAGIAHADVGKMSEAEQEKYYEVNTDLAIECCKKAKAAGVSQFIFMSSMIIYGGAERIDEHTLPHPENFYGNSKWLADKGIQELGNERFHVAVLRPPMIYGRGSRGNYSTLSKLAKKLHVFPNVDNKRSMLYIDNLCEFVGLLVLSGKSGIYFPQNKEYSNTSHIVKVIGDVVEKKVIEPRILEFPVRLAMKMPGKIGELANKAFGSSWYEQRLSLYDGLEYQKVELEESIRQTESLCKARDCKGGETKQFHILLISQYFYPETFRVNDIAVEWVKRGYKVTVLTGIPNYPMGKFFEGYDYRHRRYERWKGVDIIRIPLIARGNSRNKFINAGGMAANYLSFVVSGRRWIRKNNIHADIVFTVEVSPMTQALIGCWYGKWYKVPTYLYVQDLWPENVETVTGIHNSAVIGCIDKMVDWIYANTDQIFTTSPSFVKTIVNRKVPVKKRKVHYWPQYAEEFYKPMEAQEVEGIDMNDGCYKIAFTGNIGTAQGLDVLPKAAELLKNEAVKFVIVGDGRYQLEFERQIDECGVRDKFIMIPRVPAERVPEILSACDAGFISFNKTPLWEMTIPAKLQSYMACGKAIIASASGETRRVIEEAECGVCTEIGDSGALAEGIRRLMKADNSELGKNARKYFEKKYEKKKLMDKMDEYIKG